MTHFLQRQIARRENLCQTIQTGEDIMHTHRPFAALACAAMGLLLWQPAESVAQVKPGPVVNSTSPATTGQAADARQPAQPQQKARQPARPSKPRQAATPNALHAKCLQQVGAFIDPVTKQWTFNVDESAAMSRIEMYRMCLAGGDRAKANTVAVRERNMSPGEGGAPSRY